MLREHVAAGTKNGLGVNSAAHVHAEISGKPVFVTILVFF